MIVYMTASDPTPHALLCARRLNIPGGAYLLDLRDAHKDRCQGGLLVVQLLVAPNQYGFNQVKAGS